MPRLRAAWIMTVALSLGGQIDGAGQAEDWPGFRGPTGNGVSRETKVPLEWGPSKNVAWKVPLPMTGNGSPIVSNGHVFVVCAEDKQGTKRSLYCLDRRHGRQGWVRTVDFGKVEETHETNPYCGTTPAADGRHVVVWHGSAGLFCYDFAGQLKWSHNFGEFHHIWGYGTSPVIHGDRVIMHSGPGKRVFVNCVELSTGKVLWTTEEPTEGDGVHRRDKMYMGSWTTPLVVNVGGQDQIICPLPTRVVSYDPANGKILWFCEGMRGPKGDLAYASPVIAGDVCVVTAGFNGPGFGFKLGGSGDVTATNRLWWSDPSPQVIGSGIVVDDLFYRPNAGPGTIECIDPPTGKILWTSREPGMMWGSIVLAAGRGYVTNQAGATFVFRPSRSGFELLAKNDLGEPSNSTPAISDGQIFLRTNQHVYCIAE